MRRTGDFGALRERLQGMALTALGLVVLALLFAFLVPRREEIASSLAAARQEAEAKAVVADLRPAEPGPALGPRVANRPVPTIPSSAIGTTAPVDPAIAPEPSQPAIAAAAPPTDKAAAEPAKPGMADGRQPELLARPVALDTGTLLVGQGKVKLEGIDPVAVSERCGDGSNAWFCGSEARSRFRAWLRARSIRCMAPPNFGTAPTEIVATCDLSGEDLGTWLVSNGWARASSGGSYAEAEAKAKSAQLGIWSPRRRAD